MSSYFIERRLSQYWVFLTLIERLCSRNRVLSYLGRFLALSRDYRLSDRRDRLARSDCCSHSCAHGLSCRYRCERRWYGWWWAAENERAVLIKVIVIILVILISDHLIYIIPRVIPEQVGCQTEVGNFVIIDTLAVVATVLTFSNWGDCLDRWWDQLDLFFRINFVLLVLLWEAERDNLWFLRTDALAERICISLLVLWGAHTSTLNDIATERGPCRQLRPSWVCWSVWASFAILERLENFRWSFDARYGENCGGLAWQHLCFVFGLLKLTLLIDALGETFCRDWAACCFGRL